MRHGEGLNFKDQGGAAKLDKGDEPDRGSLNRRRLIAKPALDINSLELNCLSLFEETPLADPHEGCCGDGEGKPSLLPDWDAPGDTIDYLVD